MTNKFEIYGVIVPGTLLICTVGIFFPAIVPLLSGIKLSKLHPASPSQPRVGRAAAQGGRLSN